MDVVSVEYEEFVQPLDDDSELAVSTYAAWFPRESVSLAPLYVRLRTDDYVALKFHVRDRNSSGNTGPRIESVHVHRLAYRLDIGPETVVLTDFRDAFWMQETGTYRDRTTNGIPYREHSVLQYHGRADLEWRALLDRRGHAGPSKLEPLPDHLPLPGSIVANWVARRRRTLTARQPVAVDCWPSCSGSATACRWCNSPCCVFDELSARHLPGSQPAPDSCSSLRFAADASRAPDTDTASRLEGNKLRAQSVSGKNCCGLGECRLVGLVPCRAFTRSRSPARAGVAPRPDRSSRESGAAHRG